MLLFTGCQPLLTEKNATTDITSHALISHTDLPDRSYHTSAGSQFEAESMAESYRTGILITSEQAAASYFLWEDASESPARR